MVVYPRLASAICLAIAIPLSFALPAHALTPTTDAKYCLALSTEYGRYVAAPPFSTWGDREIVGDVAIAECKEGDAAKAIPVLEHEILRSKLNLPSRPDRDDSPSSAGLK